MGYAQYQTTPRAAKHLLVVEDDPDDFYLVKEILGRDSHNAYTLRQANSLEQAREVIAEETFDLILLDLGLQDSEGLSTLKSLLETDTSIPVIVMTGIDDERLGEEAIKLGAEDYVPKNIVSTTLLGRSIAYSIERHHLLMEIQQKAELDPLTGLLNRSALYQKLNTLIEQSRREQLPLALLMLDLDKFKEINDCFGHIAGDQLLVQVAERLTGNLRRSDAAARYGGDEFVVLITNYHSFDDLKLVLERKREILIQPYSIQTDDYMHQLDVGVSIGVKEWQPSMSVDQLFHQADMAMYQSKQRGPNNTTFA